MRKMSLTSLFVFCMFVVSGVQAESIHFSFANFQITGSAAKYVEFDVMAYAGNLGTRLGDSQVYFNYDIGKFGQSIAAHSKITVSKGELVKGELASGLPAYNIINVIDNSTSRVAITLGYNFSGSPDYANPLLDTPAQILHIKIETVSEPAPSDISFDAALMAGQEYESDNIKKYVPVKTYDAITAAVNTESNLTPEGYYLYQNYPNPFNPETEIRYSVPKENFVVLSVYNQLGQKIASLVKERKSAGIYTVKWNGMDDDGNSLSSGVYLIKMVSHDYVGFQKVTLLR
ncbi:MAG TPA: T9SS type A sorting domain-containing protein [Bacteroidetes bacterium]|nr:T9SS type A sorting domain-containing protein [Bacteroidota bacterium]